MRTSATISVSIRDSVPETAQKYLHPRLAAGTRRRWQIRRVVMMRTEYIGIKRDLACNAKDAVAHAGEITGPLVECRMGDTW